jgi:tetratricopeptide (TPR) repeat protein
LGYQQYKQIKIEATKAETVKQFMLDAFMQTNPDISKGIKVTARDLLRVSAQKLNDESGLDPQVRFELLQTLGIAYGALGIHQKAVDLLKQSLLIKPGDSHSTSYLALYLLDTSDGDSHAKFLGGIEIQKLTSNADKARVMRVRAQVYARNSEFDKAMIELSKAIELNKIDANKVEELSSIRILAEFYFRQSLPQKSIEILKQALSRTSEKIPLTVLIGLKNDLGKIYNDVGDYDLAKEIFEENLTQIRKILGNDNPELSQTLIEISFAYKRSGMLEKAQAAADESFQINLGLYGENSIQTAQSINILAAMAYQNGDTDKAIELFYKTVKIFEQQQPDDYADTLEVKTNLGLLLGFANRNEEALVVLREVYALKKEKFGVSHNMTIHSQQILARTLAELGQISEALELAELSIENAKKYLDKKHPEYVGALYTLTRIYKTNKQFKKALNTALEIENENLLDKNEPNYHILLRLIAQLYIATDMLDKGDEYYAASLKSITGLYSVKHVRTLIIQLEYAQFLAQNNQLEKSKTLVNQAKNIIAEENIQNPKIDELMSSLE